jgi:glucokinase
MERFNMSMRKYLKEVGVTSQQAIERVVREQKLAGKGKLKVKMVLTGEDTRLNHRVEGEIDLSDAAEEPDDNRARPTLRPFQKTKASRRR